MMAGRRSKDGMWLGPDERRIRSSVRSRRSSKCVTTRPYWTEPQAKPKPYWFNGGPQFQQGAGSLALFLT